MRLLKTSVLLVLASVCHLSINAQEAIKSDSLASFEIPFFLGQAEEKTKRLTQDINSLKDNVSEDIKADLYEYIYSYFTDTSSTKVKSDLRYQSSLNTQRDRSPVSLKKYLSNFETDQQIKTIVIDDQSFQFSYPQNTAPYVFEMYGAYNQHFLDAVGDTLSKDSIPKLLLFNFVRDSLTGSFDLNISSMNLLDPKTSPDFMDKQDLEIFDQQYLKWRNSGAPVQEIAIMDSEILDAMVRESQKKEKERARVFQESVNAYKAAIKRKDILSASKHYITARSLRRSDPFLIAEETELNAQLSEKIRILNATLDDAEEVLNYRDYDVISKRILEAMDYFKDINSRDADRAYSIRSAIEENTEKFETSWNDLIRKSENATMRPGLKSTIEEYTKGKNCSSQSEDANLSKFLTLLGIIELKDPVADRKKQAQALFTRALACKADFAMPKIELIKISESDSTDRALEYYENLSFYEPYNPAFHLEVALLKEARGYREQAIESYSKTLEYDPNNIEALEHLSLIYIRLKRWDDAIYRLESLTSIEDNQGYQTLLAHAYLERDGFKSKDAARISSTLNYDSMIGLEKSLNDSIFSIYQDSSIYNISVQQRYYKAAEFYEKMLLVGGTNRNNYAEWANGAACYYILGNQEDYFERANVMADSAISHSSGKSGKAYLYKGRINRETENFQEAKKAFFSLLELDNTHEINFEIGETYYQEGREYTVARIYFERALEMLPKKSENSLYYNYYLRIGQSHRDENMFKESLKALKSASKKFKDRGEPNFEMGLTYQATGEASDLKKSVKSFDKARAKNYEGYKSFSNMLSALYKLEDYKDIKELYVESGYQYEDRMSNQDWTQLVLTDFFLDDLNKSNETLNRAAGIASEFRNTNTYQNLQGFIYLKKAVSISMTQSEKDNFLSNAEEQFEISLNNSVTDALAFLGKSMTNYYKESSSDYVQNLRSALTFDVEIMNFQSDSEFNSYFKERSVKDAIKEFKE